MTHSLPSWIHFFERKFPSANMALIHGNQPVLIDTGFGSDASETVQLLRDAGVPPESLQMIINTHYHCDHTGGNHTLQRKYGVEIAAYYQDAAMMNKHDREAGAIRWLGQVVEPYHVNRAMYEGDVIDTGTVALQVIHTPGHTLGHICLYADGVLIAGDVCHSNDVAWLNPFREGAGAIYRIMETLDKLARMPIHWLCSGHSAPTSHPIKAIDAARRRYESWLQDPAKIGWHACKRIFTYYLMLVDGLPEAEIKIHLMNCHWYLDYTRHIFEQDPSDFVAPFIQELLRSGAAYWRNEKLFPTAPYTPPDLAWLKAVPLPENW